MDNNQSHSNHAWIDKLETRMKTVIQEQIEKELEENPRLIFEEVEEPKVKSKKKKK